MEASSPLSSLMPQGRRPRIAVLLGEMDGEYHDALLDGVCDTAERLGIDLIFAPARSPGEPSLFGRQFAMLSHMVREHAPEGLLIFGTLMQSHTDEDELRRFIATFSQPAVVIGVPDTGNPTVLIDNVAGFKALVLHLIRVHGHRRIAIVEGPPDNRDARERLAAYLQAHDEAGIEVDPLLRVKGEFHPHSGSAAMAELLDRGASFTALVCANDESAYGALSTAVDRGLRVPEDIAIAGFDDLLSIFHVGPSLTTVNQDLEAQVSTALSLLMKHMRGEPVPLLTAIPTRPVFRRTCGCMGFDAPSVRIEHGKLETVKALVSEMHAPVALVDQLVDDVMALVEALTASDGRVVFDQILTRLAFAWLKHQADITPLQTLLVSMQRAFAGSASGSNPGDAAELLQFGQIVLANVLELFHTRARVALGNSGWALRHQLKSQVTTVDIEELLKVLGGALKQLGVSTCILALYERVTTIEDVERLGLPESSTLVMALDRGVLRETDVGGSFPTRLLLPAAFAPSTTDPRSWVVLPMFYMREHFGYMLLERHNGERATYTDLHHEITGALHSCLIVRELGSARDRLRQDLDRAHRDNEALSHLAMRDELTGLFNRRGFFELARSMMTTARLTERPLTLFFADLDGLKLINDRHGHEEGDEAIRAAAKVLLHTFRQDDVVSRLGGDEFVILTGADNLGSLPDIERRLDANFAAHNVSRKKPYEVTCSLGGILVPPDSTEPLDEMLARADQLLYAAKRRRKGLA